MSAARSPAGRRSLDSTLRTPKKVDSRRARSRVSPASKFFDQKSDKLPEPISYLHYSTADSSPVSRPPKPVGTEASSYGPDDPLYKIEESTSRITSLVSDYERQRQESNMKMLAELDSCFQLDSNEPKEILEQSKTIVDGLMNQNRALKDSQSSMLGSLQTWMKHEGQSIVGSDNFTSSALGTSVDDLVAVLSSNEGITQEKISKAVALHSDIVTKAFLAIHIYQKRIAEQEKLINELKTKCSSTPPQVRYRRPLGDADDLQKQLEKSHSRVKQQEDVIRSLNERIEQLIAEMLSGEKDKNDDAVAEENIRKGRDILELETKMDHLQSRVNELSDENYKLKEKLQESESDAVYYKGMVKNMKERADLERNRRGSEAKELLEKISARENGAGISDDLKEALEKVIELESQNDQLVRELEKKEDEYRKKYRKQVADLRKEFEAKELEARKKQLLASVPEESQAIVKALENHHEEELANLRKEYEAKMASMQKGNGDLLKKSLAEKNDKIRELQLMLERGIENMGDAEMREALAKLKATYEDQLREKEEKMANKMEKMKNEFAAMQQKLLSENKQKGDELRNLMFAASDKSGESPEEDQTESTAPKEDVDVVIPKLSNSDVEASVSEAIEQYKEQAEEKMRERQEELEKFWTEKYSEDTDKLKAQMEAKTREAEETESQLREKIDELISENEQLKLQNDYEDLKEHIRKLEEENASIGAKNQKLAKENDLLHENAKKGNGDAALSDLTTAFVDQSEELAQLKEEVDKLRAVNVATGQIEPVPHASPRSALRKLDFVSHDALDIVASPLSAGQSVRSERLEDGVRQEGRSVSLETSEPTEYGYEALQSSARSQGLGLHASSRSVHEATPGADGPVVSQSAADSGVQARDLISEAQQTSSRGMVDRLVSARSAPGASPLVMFRPMDITVPPSEQMAADQKSRDADMSGSFAEVVSSRTTGVASGGASSQVSARANDTPSPAAVASDSVYNIPSPASGATGDASAGTNPTLAVVPNTLGSYAHVACQVGRAPVPNVPLAIQPSFELFSAMHDVVSSQETIILNPSPAPVLTKNEKQPPTHLITSDGQLVAVPHLAQIDDTTHPLAVHTATKNVIDDTLQKASELTMVVSEMQAIEDEADPQKKQRLRETLKPTLDVEKDSIVSEMKEKISQLEQLVHQTEGNKHGNGMEIATQTHFSVIDASKSSQDRSTTGEVEMVRVPSEDFVRTQAQAQISHTAMESRSTSEAQATPSRLGLTTESSVTIGPSEGPSAKYAKDSYVDHATQMSSRSQAPGNSSASGPSPIAQTSQAEPEQKTAEPPKPAQRTRMKMNAAPAKRMQHRFYSSEVIEILPTLKGQLNAIQQSETPGEAQAALANITQNLNSMSTSITSQMEPAVAITDAAPDVQSFETTSSNLQAAVDSADGLVQRVAEKQEAQLEVQSRVVKKLNDTAMSFLKKMDQPGGAGATEQSEFLRDVNKATTTLSSSVNELNGESESFELLRKNLMDVRAEYDKQCQLVDSLRREIVKLKTFHDMPQVGRRLTQVRDDLKSLASGNHQQTQVIKSLDHARQSVPTILRSCSNDGVIARVGAKSDIQKAADSVPHWEDVVANIDGAVEKLEKDTVDRRNGQLLQSLNDQNNLLMSEVQKLRTKTVINDRDTDSVKKTSQANVQDLKAALDMAHEQIAIMERQLRSADHEAELAAAHQLERERYQQLCDEQKKTSQLTNEITDLKDKLHDLQQRFQDMFSTATDTQTSNQILQNRTNEMLMRAQLDADKARALERMQNDTVSDLEEATKKITRLVDENADLQKQIAKLETELQDMRRQNLDLTVYNTLKGKDGKAEIPKLIRLYQDRAALYQDQLERKTRALMEMKTKRACDQKSIILINREQTRLKEQIRLAQIKYEAAKGQVSVSDKALAGRDQTIRELRREIERLRSLLRMNAPLQKKLREMQKNQNETCEEIKHTEEEIAKAERAKDRFSGAKAVSNYFDKMLQRNRDRLAKLELQRKAYKDQERLNEIENLRAISQIVRESEIDIPESLVVQMMPKPEPVKTLPKKPRVEHTENFEKPYMPEWQAPSYKVTSYADNLQFLGSLVGKKSPRTLQKMLRNARHNQVVVPSSEMKKSPTRRRQAERLPDFSPMTVTPIKR